MPCVFVSHKHADHILGLPALLAARAPHAPPLLVVGPWEAARWLGSIGRHHPSWRYEFVHCGAFASAAAGDGSAAYNVQGHVLRALGFAAWRCVEVQHCSDAWGISLSHSQARCRGALQGGRVLDESQCFYG